jgi:hypothetical protein
MSHRRGVYSGISVFVVVGVVLTVTICGPKHLRACPTRVIDAQGWQTLPLPYGPFIVRVPHGATRNPVQLGWSEVYGPNWYLRFGLATIPVDLAPHFSGDQSLDLVSHPLADESYLPIPPSIATIGASYCTDTMAGRPMRIRLYQTRMYASGSYRTDAAWPVTPGSWLVVDIASGTAAIRDTMLAVLRSLHVDTSAAMLATVHPRTACPPWPDVPAAVLSQRRYVGSVVFDTPAQLKEWQGAFTAAWDIPKGGDLRFTILRTPGWQLPPLPTPLSPAPQGSGSGVR